MSREFWEKQAETFKNDVNAVNFDPIQEELELFTIEKFIEDNETIFDMGCGNGRTLINLAQEKRGAVFYGADFAQGMIKAAEAERQKIGLDNLHFYHLDSVSPELPEKLGQKFDKIITKRLLINLKGRDKIKAIENIYTMLKDNGTYIMIECFTEPLKRINDIRSKINLDEIKVKYFNEYLSHDFLKNINDKFEIEESVDFASLYYFISRIFNAYLSEGNPDYYAPINKLAVELIKKGFLPIVGYSPEIIYILKKKS